MNHMTVPGTRYQYNGDRPALDDIINFKSHLIRHSCTYKAQDCTCTVLYGFVHTASYVRSDDEN
jgi:hypothetical protein